MIPSITRSGHESIYLSNHCPWTVKLRRLSRWWIVVVGVVFQCSIAAAQAQDFTCDFQTDQCPTKQNGVCESSWGTQPSNDPSCRNGDCLDCNYLCGQFNSNCTGCLTTAGCYWCPTDAICNNSPLYLLNVNTTCVSAEHYIASPNEEKCTNPDSVFSDPLFPAQEWIFQQINIYPVWQQNIYGTGVRVRINDDGIDGSIRELTGRFDENSSCVDFAPMDAEAIHGTAVASIVGGEGNNGECGVGIAPGVIISSCNAFAVQALETFTDFDFQLDQFDISHNSIGVSACTDPDDETIIRRRKLQECPFVDPEASPCQVCDFNNAPSDACEQAIISHCQTKFYRDEIACLEFLDLLIATSTCNYNLIPSSMLDAIAQGVANGRDGKGAIYVFASGNEFQTGGDSNFGGLTNSRLTITVGAVGKDELHASYSNPGASILVSAPGGDDGFASNHISALPGGGCKSDAIGTSFAAPVVSGVIALMLEVNPDLTWRDVHGILAQTSRMITTDPVDTTRVTNAAGFTHSNFYGFGIVDANASVTAAKSWKLFCPERYIPFESGPVNVTLVDDGGSSTAAHSITVKSADVDGDFVIESVMVLLDIQHFSRGDLEVVLTSPNGTPSILHPGDRPENTISEERWKLMTLRNWGEGPVGDWTLSIRDVRSGDLADCVDAPFLARYLENNIDCQFLSTQGYCKDGAIVANMFEGTALIALLAFQYGGFVLDEACCACGGGFTTNDFIDQLQQWRMIIYGRSKSCEKDDDEEEKVLSLFPSDSPSMVPSLAPSNRTISPSVPSPVTGTDPTTTTTTTPPQQPETSSSKAEVENQQRLVTIFATIIGFLIILCCVYFLVRGDRTSRWKSEKPAEQAPGEGGGDFQNIHGEVA